LGFWHFKLALA